MNKDYYTFPAIFTEDEDGISIEFPDLPGCLPCADTLDEAAKNAREALGLHLCGMEQDGEAIPAPSALSQIEVPENGTLFLADVFMPTFRQSVRNVSVKKTLTIPAYLNAEAERAGVNFSAILQNALKRELHLR